MIIMKIKTKHIGALFIFTMLCLLLLQGMWLYNTYNMSRVNVENKVNEILLKSIEHDADIRFARSTEKNTITPPDSSLVFNFKYDEKQGMATQQKQVIQEMLVFDGFPFELSTLDSLYQIHLNQENLYTNYLIQYSNSTGIIKATDKTVSGKAFKTDLFPIAGGASVQAFVDIPVPVVFKQDMLILGSSTLLVVLLVIFLFYILRIIYLHESLLQLRENFTDALTHNMRTPLSVIHTVTDSFRKDIETHSIESQKNMLERAYKQSCYLLSIVDEILSISRFEHKKIILDIEEVNIKEMTIFLKDKHSIPLRNKTVNIILDCEVNEPVLVDNTHLTSAVDNLIDNAIKYSNDSVDIQMKCFIQKDMLHINVRDNGIGISKKNLKCVFDKFERADVAKSNKAKGFGLGLTYVKWIAEAHGGNISVKSEENVGSEFVITIPVRKKPK